MNRLSHLFLSGGGNEKQSRKLDALFVSTLPRGKRILYIPVAMSRWSHSFGECFDWFSTTFERLKAPGFDMWTDTFDRTYVELKKYATVYIGGGNTFSLLHQFRASGFDKLLMKYWREGGIVYGGSAGAIILGKDIGTAIFGGDSDENIVGIRNLRGLDLANGYSIACHYREKDDSRLSGYVRKHAIEVVAMPEDAGLHTEGERIIVVGFSSAYLFSKKRESCYRTKPSPIVPSSLNLHV